MDSKWGLVDGENVKFGISTKLFYSHLQLDTFRGGKNQHEQKRCVSHWCAFHWGAFV